MKEKFKIDLDINLNTLFLYISNITQLQEDDIDDINKALFDNLKKLSRTKDLVIKLLNTTPVLVWVYLSTLVKYTDKTVTIYTVESKEQVSEFLESERLIIKQIKE
jgi:hypothetical protein